MTIPKEAAVPQMSKGLLEAQIEELQVSMFMKQGEIYCLIHPFLPWDYHFNS